MKSDSGKQPGTATFTFIFVTVMLDMLALGVMVPILPKLILEFQSGDVSSSARITGLFGFAWAAMQFGFSPVLGALSDRFGRRPVILLSNLGLGLDYVLMAVAPSLPWLFLGRLVSGITSSSFPTACAYIADITPPEKRAARFGLLSAAFGLGFIVGPSLGGFLGEMDLRLPFWVSAGLSLANAVYGYFVLPESHPPERRPTTIVWKDLNPWGAMRFLRSFPGMLGLIAVLSLYFLAHESLPSVFVLYANYRYHWDNATVGAVLAGVGISSTIVSALVVGPVVKKFGERRALLAGTAFGTLGFFIYGAASTGAMFLVGVPVHAVWGLIGPAVQSLLSAQVPGSQQGQLQGAISSLRGVIGMAGPLFFTQIFATSVGPSALLPYPGMAFLVASLLLLLGFATAWISTRQLTRSEPLGPVSG